MTRVITIVIIRKNKNPVNISTNMDGQDSYVIKLGFSGFQANGGKTGKEAFEI